MARNLTQGALAALVGVSRQTINEIESGQKKNLSVTTLLRLAYALAVRPECLLGYPPAPEPGSVRLFLLGRLPHSQQ